MPSASTYGGVDVLEIASADRPTVTISTAVTEVTIAEVNVKPILIDGTGKTGFAATENAVVLGVGIRMPYDFNLSTEPLKVKLMVLQKSNGNILQTLGTFFVPVANQEVPLNIMVTSPGAAWQLAMEVLPTAKVSMLNVGTVTPTLTGTIGIGGWARVQHLQLGLAA